MGGILRTSFFILMRPWGKGVLSGNLKIHHQGRHRLLPQHNTELQQVEKRWQTAIVFVFFGWVQKISKIQLLHTP